LESTRLAEQELQRGTLIVPSFASYVSVLRETHFLSYRTADRRVPNVVQFREWLFAEAGVAG